MKKTLLYLFLAGLTSANAQTVQEQFTDLIKQRNDTLKAVLESAPVLQNFNFVLQSFTPNSDTSAAKSTLNLSLPEGESLSIAVNANITHGQAEKTNGMIFKSRETLVPTRDMPNGLQLFLMQSELISEMSTAGTKKEVVYTKPTNFFESDGSGTQFFGASLAVETNKSEDRNIQFKFQGIESASEDTTINIQPFSIDGNKLNNGAFEFGSTPVNITGSNKGEPRLLSIAKLSGKGKLNEHPETKIILGSSNLTIDKINVNFGEQIKFNKIIFNSEGSLDENNFVTQDQNMLISADQASILNATQNQFGFTTAKVNISAGNMSPETLREYAELQKRSANLRENADVQKDLLRVADGLRSTNSTLGVNLDVLSSLGPIKINANLLFRKGGPSTASIFSSSDPKKALKAVDFDIDISLPKKLVNKLGGAAPMPPQMFMQLKGNSYIANIKNSNGNLTINGQPAPF